MGRTDGKKEYRAMLADEEGHDEQDDEDMTSRTMRT